MRVPEGTTFPAELTLARILLVDDELSNVQLLRRLLLSHGFTRLAETTDPLQAMSLFESFDPDLVCLDLHMSPLDGFGVLEQLASRIPEGSYLPILMLTGDSTDQAKRRALALGARDFLTKPFDTDEAMLRIHNLLLPRFMHLELARHNHRLEHEVAERTRDLEESRLDVLERLVRAAEFRDDATGQHAQRVGLVARRLAERAGLSQPEAELVFRAAPLHDIGKIGIPDSVLLKPGILSPEEFEIMKRHTLVGAEILSGGRTPLMRTAAEIALCHHERWDGGGYPGGLQGAAIPLSARLVALADVFDALTHERPYREAWPLDDVLREMRRQAGMHFDPLLLEHFLELPHRQLF